MRRHGRTTAIDATGWSNGRGEGRFLRGLLGEMLGRPGRSIGATSIIAERHAAAEIRDRFPSVPVLGLPDGCEPGTGLAAGATRTPGQLLALSRAVGITEASALLQPSVVGWFPTPGVPQAVVVHDVKPPTGDLFYGGRVAGCAGAVKQALALRSAAALLPVSGTACRQLGEAGHAATVAPLGAAIDPAFRPRREAEVSAARDAVGLDAGRRYLLLASGLNRHKDARLPIEALPLLDRRGGPAAGLDLVLVGEPKGYGGSAEGIIAAARRRDLGNRLLTPGYISDARLAALYSGAEAAITTSRFEGLGMSPLEARGCGCRIVASDIPAHRETSGDVAVFFRPGDPAALADAVAEALDRPPIPPAANYSWRDPAAAVCGSLESLGRGSKRWRSALRR